MCRCGAATQREAESFFEYEDPSTAQKYYYWEVWHQPPNAARIHKMRSTAQLLTQDRVNTLDQRLSEDWYRRLQYAEGQFYVYRYAWDGTAWRQESCNRGEISSGVVYRC